MAGAVTVNGTLAVTASSSLLTGANNLTVAATGQANISGLLNLSGTATFSLGKVDILAGGTFNDGNNTVTISGTGANTWINAGTFTTGGTTTFTGATPQIGASNFNNVNINVGSGNTATLTGAATLAGTLTITSGSLATNGNNLSVTGAATIDNSGTLSLSGPEPIPLPASPSTRAGPGPIRPRPASRSAAASSITAPSAAGNETYMLTGIGQTINGSTRGVDSQCRHHPKHRQLHQRRYPDASSDLSGTGTLINAATGVLNLGGITTISTLTATAVGNTVNYNGAGARRSWRAPITTCKLSTGGAKNTQAVATVAGTLTIQNSATMFNNGVLTVDGALNYTSNGTTTLVNNITIASLNQSGTGTLADGGNTITVTGTGRCGMRPPRIPPREPARWI